jgi:hypothetical protein
MQRTATILIPADKVKEAKRSSRNLIGKIPGSRVFKSKIPRNPIEDDSLADPNIRILRLDKKANIRYVLVDAEVVFERYGVSETEFPLSYPKFRFVPRNEIWVLNEEI